MAVLWGCAIVRVRAGNRALAKVSVSWSWGGLYVDNFSPCHKSHTRPPAPWVVRPWAKLETHHMVQEII